MTALRHQRLDGASVWATGPLSRGAEGETTGGALAKLYGPAPQEVHGSSAKVYRCDLGPRGDVCKDAAGYAEATASVRSCRPGRPAGAGTGPGPVDPRTTSSGSNISSSVGVVWPAIWPTSRATAACPMASIGCR